MTALHEQRCTQGGGGFRSPVTRGGGICPPPSQGQTHANKQARPFSTSLLDDGSNSHTLCAKHPHRETKRKPLAASLLQAGRVALNIHRGVYMGALVRELSCRAPCAQRLPNDAQAQVPSPKHVTAANPLSMNHDMHTLIPPLHCAPPHRHHIRRHRFHPCYNTNSFACPWTLVRGSRSKSRVGSHAKTAAAHALAAPQ